MVFFDFSYYYTSVSKTATEWDLREIYSQSVVTFKISFFMCAIPIWQK